MSKIEWTEVTWNPVIGCSRVSEGCRNCYAERMAVRLANMGRSEYDGLTNGDLRKPRWTGTVRMIPERLDEPRRWTSPKVVFVNSMSDLLHEDLTVAEIRQVVEVMRATPEHIYQVLTKRPERLEDLHSAGIRWPDNVWLGVSVEDQKSADQRLPLLAAQRYAFIQWVSYEPAIGPVDWTPWATKIDWIVVGGESGPKCRPFSLGWAREAINAFHAAQKPVFVKQVGGHVAGSGKKGNDPTAWPADIRVREFPATAMKDQAPSTGTPPGRRLMSTCVHEAAHGIVAMLVGAALDSICVDAEGDRNPHALVRFRDTASPESQGLTYAAGPAASAHYGKTSIVRELLGAGLDDLRQLRLVVPDPDEQLRVMAGAEVMVAANWEPILGLAKELRRRGRMSLAEVRVWVNGVAERIKREGAEAGG